MSSRLNKEYFDTKRKHQEGYRKKKLTLKKVIFNLTITLVILFLYNIFYNYLSKKTEENKKEDTSQLYINPAINSVNEYLNTNA
ncbi:hypothetical protein MK851_04410 [Tenacibaculum sp. 1B UA]|uniref:hypothetical protein n=1 Tax=Tenacibaculum sp. 1B UA TaxID=2922252 RepID=UPI002A244F1F|nr:hypothetical protein [Tenacibaculum sp. 1B UA]MDX8552869.1 hypothetical protein [Tenacibaculum sp. 1B UA]